MGTTERIIKVNNMQGEMKALMIHDVRFTEVNGVDTSFNLPHVYIYSPNPYVEGTKESDYTDDGKPVHFWGRVHKNGMGSKAKEYELALAEGKKGMENLNIEMFHSSLMKMGMFAD